MHQHLPLLAKSSKRLLNAPQLGAILGYRRTPGGDKVDHPAFVSTPSVLPVLVHQRCDEQR